MAVVILYIKKERKRIKPSTPMLVFILCSRNDIMITYFTNNFNNNYQSIYNQLNTDVNLLYAQCPCGLKGNLIRYGFYTRYIKTPSGLVQLKIQRVKCKVCGHTHAILLSCMIPYSQILFKDTLDIIRSTSIDDLKQIMMDNLSIDESNISYVKRQFHKHWEQRLLSEQIRLDDSLVFQCFFHYRRQFMQIKCTANTLLYFTNIT